MSQLTLDDNHIYRLDNVIIPSVTQIIQSAGLTDFSQVPASVLEASRLFGKAAHKACELWDNGELDEEALDPALKPYLDGWKLFRQEYGFVLEKIEWQAYSPVYRFAGTIDRIGKWRIDDTLIIADIKTGVDSPATAIQLAGYELLLRENLKPKGKIKKLPVLLNGEGTYKIKEYSNKKDKDVFICALSLYNWRKKNNGK